MKLAPDPSFLQYSTKPQLLNLAEKFQAKVLNTKFISGFNFGNIFRHQQKSIFCKTPFFAEGCFFRILESKVDFSASVELSCSSNQQKHCFINTCLSKFFTHIPYVHVTKMQHNQVSHNLRFRFSDQDNTTRL